MSLSTVLKNVYTFAQILGQADGNAASHWDVQAWQNAQRWAAYCQQISEQLTDSRVKKAFNKKLMEMTLLVEPSSCVCLSVDILSKAATLLKQTLLQNLDTNRKVVNHIRTEKENNDKNVLKRFEELVDSDFVGDLPEEVIDILQDTEVTSRDVQTTTVQCCEHMVTQIQAQALLAYLVVILDKNCHERIPHEVYNLISRIACLAQGWEILVTMLHSSTSESSDSEDRVKPCIVKWMSSRTEHYKYIWKVPHAVVVMAAKHHSEFFILYLKLLTWLCNQMDVDYHHFTQGRLYTWRSTSEMSVDFDDIVKRYLSLLSSDVTVRRHVITHLKENTDKSLFNIWRDICRKLF